ncbi:hypothetical protein A0O28_0028210 [Trichoderma guizhouense]|uniref:Xylanolytic transcriptional activator regulatory domain-containing protein n=1 Tax=Trichoderma guizhouense TaxID=1491466 RepID=A0A1T3CTY4_9HYPO|nr:hypothetical protein A0O28_0028210 [Trichoderma guizhouense]
MSETENPHAGRSPSGQVPQSTSVRDSPSIDIVFVGVAIRIAQSLGLHRDPSRLHIKLSVIEIEMRRRLWFYVCGLDQISAEFHGPRPSIRIDDFDTLLPRNVDDADLSYESRVGIRRLPDGGRFTDMTVLLIRISTVRCFMVLDRMFRESSSTVPGDVENGADLQSDVRNQNVNAVLEKMEQFIESVMLHHEEEYLKFSNRSDPMHKLTRLLAETTKSKLWIFYYRLLSGHSHMLQTGLGMNSRERYLSRCVALLEILDGVVFDPATQVCYWLSSGILQLHALFQALQELLCSILNREDIPNIELLSRCRSCIDAAKLDFDSKEWALLRHMKEMAETVRIINQTADTQKSVLAENLLPPGSGSAELEELQSPPSTGSTSQDDLLTDFNQAEYINDLADQLWPLANREWHDTLNQLNAGDFLYHGN